MSRLVRLCATGCVVIVTAGLVVWGRYHLPGPLTGTVTVVIPPGAGAREIIGGLARQGVVSPAWSVLAVVRLSGDHRRLQAGEYRFGPGDSPDQVIARIVAGAVVLRLVTIPEGWSSARVVARLRAMDDLTGTLTEVPAEGSLLPESYDYRPGEDRSVLLGRMGEAMLRTRKEIWSQRDRPHHLTAVDDMVTLASIVEMEAARDDERSRIAGVFLRRLALGMRLQSDPTVLYALERAGRSQRAPLSRADLRFDHPFNTYARGGLPPAPISNPGRAAMEAVARPLMSDDLYFVADGQGGHLFSSTLAEHRKNISLLRSRR